MPVDTSHPAPARKPPARHAAKTPVPSARTAAREQSLTSTSVMVSMALVMRGLHADAGAVAQHAPGICHEIAALAESNDQIASWVDYLSEAGPYMGLAMAVLPLALQIAANHGRIDARKMPPAAGIVPPEILEAKVKAEASAALAELEAEYAMIRGLESADA